MLTVPGIEEIAAAADGRPAVARSSCATPDNESPAASTAGTIRLEMDGVRLPGRLVDGREQPGASCLVWQPLGSATASPLRPGSPGRIIYRSRRPSRRRRRQFRPAAAARSSARRAACRGSSVASPAPRRRRSNNAAERRSLLPAHRRHHPLRRDQDRRERGLVPDAALREHVRPARQGQGRRAARPPLPAQVQLNKSKRDGCSRSPGCRRGARPRT